MQVLRRLGGGLSPPSSPANSAYGHKLPGDVSGGGPAASEFCAFYLLSRAFWSIEIQIAVSSTNELNTSQTLSPATADVD